MSIGGESAPSALTIADRTLRLSPSEPTPGLVVTATVVDSLVAQAWRICQVSGLPIAEQREISFVVMTRLATRVNRGQLTDVAAASAWVCAESAAECRRARRLQEWSRARRSRLIRPRPPLTFQTEPQP